MMIFKSFRYVGMIVLMLLSTLSYVSGSKWKYWMENGGQGSCKCGVLKAENSRVTNGHDVIPPDKYPWIVSIVLTSNGQKHCGGAIISPHVVLTAAHCIQRGSDLSERNKRRCYKSKWTKDVCWLGPNNINVALVRKEQTFVTIYSSVFKVIKHPDYQAFNFKADIALIILNDPIPCNDEYQPICLPKRPIARYGLKVTVAGWGFTTGQYESPANQLQEGMMVIREHLDCLNEPAFQDTDLDGTLCLGGYRKQSACLGDSGGPLFIQVYGVFYHLGITSMHSSLTCASNKHAIFTDTYYYMDWIKDNLYQYS